MKKFTNEDVWQMWESSPVDVYRAVVTGRLWESKCFEDVDSYVKCSITRKAFRYVAEQSVKGTIPATKTAVKLGFHKMDNGDPCPIGDESNFGWMGTQSFTDKQGDLIQVELNPSCQITFSSIKGSKTVERPTGLHFDYIHTCVDIPRMYEDPRNNWKIQ